MPRVKQFQVLLNDPDKTYVTGDTISGRVIVEIVEKPLELRAVRVTFKGKGKVEWDEVSGDEVKERSKTEIYFRHIVTVFGKEQGDKGPNETLQPGEYSYPFSYMLPPDLPSTFESSHGYIKYYVKAKIDRPWKVDTKDKVKFKVIETVNINDPQLMEPVECEQEDHYCCWCCKSGPVKLWARIDKTGYYLGDKIPITVNIENGDNDPVKEVTLKLKQKVVEDDGKGHEKSNKTTVAEQELQVDVPGHDSKRIDEMSVISPTDIIPTMLCSGVISVDYQLVVSAAMHEFKFTICLAARPALPGGVMYAPDAAYPPPIIAQPGMLPYPSYPPMPSAPPPIGLDPAMYPPVQSFGMGPIPSAPPPAYGDATKTGI